MGRQIPVLLSREKEKEFVRFLKQNNAVLIYPWSEHKRLKILTELPPTGSWNYFFDIWNKKFKFKAEFIKIKEEYRTREYKYAFHSTGKPVIEYSRGEIPRIYWEKYFVTNKPEYNVEEFEKWYNEVVKWFKKNCKYKNGVYVG